MRLVPLEETFCLNMESPFKLLVSTMLSAQATDKSVMKVTKTLFDKYKTADDFSRLAPMKLEKAIKSIGLSKSKSKNIVATSKILLEEYGGDVPRNIADLIRLPGVGRKTANVVLGNFFGIPAITVDTHVKRIVFRIGLTINKDPGEIEFDLQKIVPKKEWTRFAHLLIRLGREICNARNPDCKICPIFQFCERNI